jgi:hypothetical protein
MFLTLDNWGACWGNGGPVSWFFSFVFIKVHALIILHKLCVFIRVSILIKFLVLKVCGLQTIVLSMVTHHCWNSPIVPLMEILFNHHEGSLMCHYPIFLLPMTLEVIKYFLLNLMWLLLTTIGNLLVNNGCQRNGTICLIWDLVREVNVINTRVEVQACELLRVHLVSKVCESVLAPLCMRVLGVIIINKAFCIIVHKRLVFFKLNDLWATQALYIKLEVTWLTPNAIHGEALILIVPFILLILAPRIYRSTILASSAAHALSLIWIISYEASTPSSKGARSRLGFLSLLSGLRRKVLVPNLARFPIVLLRNNDFLLQRSTEVVIVVWVSCLVCAAHWSNTLVLRRAISDTNVDCCVLWFCLMHLLM